jgi:hypothetical protein
MLRRVIDHRRAAHREGYETIALSIGALGEQVESRADVLASTVCAR